MKARILIVVVFVLGFVLAAEARIVLPKLFGDNMVLQRGTEIPVWGWAEPNESIEIRLNRQTATATADASGKWTLKLKPETATGPFTLTIKGSETIEIRNVLVGEVWLCSGQSNMEWSLAQVKSDADIAAADNPYIRHIKIGRDIDGRPQTEIKKGEWQVTTPENARAFSAVAYFFGKNLYDRLKVPIGLINSSWGGTNIETWISREGFESSSEFRDLIARMPVFDVNAIDGPIGAAITKRVESVQGSPLTPFDQKQFMSIGFDDSKLPSLVQPKYWEGQSLGETDGVVWVRKSFTLTSEQAARSAKLLLAKIDDEDVTYINGVQVGATAQWNADRRYDVPGGVLNPGLNVVTVRITDNGGGGGMYGDAKDVRLDLGDSSVDLSGIWKFHVESVKFGVNVNQFPSLAYNAMINPLIPYSFRGVIWYQGEANNGRAYQYRTAFPLLIEDWRKKWKSDFPFYFVQLATYRQPGNSNEGCPWAELREAQTMTTSVSGTGMVVTTDIGNPDNIHPVNKQDVGRRLAALAFNRTYKLKMVDSGPTYSSMKVSGNQVSVAFAGIGGGLKSSLGKKVGGFEIAGADQVFYPADAVLEGNSVIVTSDKVASPVAVRFGWLGDASANSLFNKEGFPAVPFRTDDWKTVTNGVKYAIPDMMREINPD